MEETRGISQEKIELLFDLEEIAIFGDETGLSLLKVQDLLKRYKELYLDPTARLFTDEESKISCEIGEKQTCYGTHRDDVLKIFLMPIAKNHAVHINQNYIYEISKYETSNFLLTCLMTLNHEFQHFIQKKSSKLDRGLNSEEQKLFCFSNDEFRRDIRDIPYLSDEGGQYLIKYLAEIDPDIQVFDEEGNLDQRKVKNLAYSFYFCRLMERDARISSILKLKDLLQDAEKLLSSDSPLCTLIKDFSYKEIKKERMKYQKLKTGANHVYKIANLHLNDKKIFDLKLWANKLQNCETAEKKDKMRTFAGTLLIILNLNKKETLDFCSYCRDSGFTEALTIAEEKLQLDK